MISYSYEGGYGNNDVVEARKVIDQYLPVGSRDKVILLELLYDYEVLLKVIRGEGCVYRHPDGSETRRIKFYGS